MIPSCYIGESFKIPLNVSQAHIQSKWLLSEEAAKEFSNRKIKEIALLMKSISLVNHYYRNQMAQPFQKLKQIYESNDQTVLAIELCNPPNYHHIHALFAAIGNFQSDELSGLLKGNFDINGYNRLGMTPLSFASRGGAVECVRVLVNHPEIDREKKDKDGKIPEDHTDNEKVLALLNTKRPQC